MFSKLLKYDFKSLKRIGIPVLIGILAATVLGCVDSILLSNLYDWELNDFWMSLLGVILVLMKMVVTSVLAVGASVIQIMVCVDFFKSLASDEGYLTFTLPVKSDSIILSKMTNSTIWNFIVGIAVVCSFIIIELVGSDLSNDSTIIPSITDGSGAGALVCFIILLVLLLIVSFFNSQLLYFLAIFFGAVIAKKHKAVGAVGCVIAVNSIYGTVVGIISVIAFIGIGVSSDPFVSINIVLGIFILLLAIVTVLFYFLLKHLMEKRLNLA
ncbi:MAG: hypothetical protein J6B29_04635 [Clostridia bacterium]|nr:hypothetical protein [Clostridia bacterium]